MELERLILQVSVAALVTPRSTRTAKSFVRIIVILAHALAAFTAFHFLDVEAFHVFVSEVGSGGLFLEL